MAVSIPSFLQDNFLTCKICFDVYKEPKILVCLHSFCLRCLENHLLEANRSEQSGAIICPVCREKTLLSIDGVRSLKSNFYIKNLIEFVEASALGESSFSSANDNSNECKSENTEGSVHHDRSYLCKRHGVEIQNYFCHSCNTPVCRLCIRSLHKSHEFTKSCDKLAADLSMTLRSVNEKIDTLKEYLTNIDSRREEIIAEQTFCVESINATSTKIMEKLKCETQRTLDNIKGRFDELDSKLAMLHEAGRKDLDMMESFVKASIADLESGKYDLNHLKTSMQATVTTFENCLSKYQYNLTTKQKIRMQLTETAKDDDLYKLFEIVNDEPLTEAKKVDAPAIVKEEITEYSSLSTAYDEVRTSTDKGKADTASEAEAESTRNEVSALTEVSGPMYETNVTAEGDIFKIDTVMSSVLVTSNDETIEDLRMSDTSALTLAISESSEVTASERVMELTSESMSDNAIKANAKVSDITESLPLMKSSSVPIDADAVVITEGNEAHGAEKTIEENVAKKEMSITYKTTAAPTEMNRASAESLKITDTTEVKPNLPPKIPKRSILIRRSASFDKKAPRKNMPEMDLAGKKQFTGLKLHRSNSFESTRTVNQVKEVSENEMNDRSTGSNGLMNFFQCCDESDRIPVKLTAVQWYDSNTFVVIDENNGKMKYIRADNGQCLKSIRIKNVVSMTSSKSILVFGLREPRIIYININEDQHQVKLPFTREEVRPVVSIHNEELVAVVCTDRLLIISKTHIEERHLVDLKDKPLRVKPMFASSYKNIGILVSDWLQHRICFLSDSGNLFLQIKMSSIPTSEGIFRTPGDLCADSTGNVYVVEYWKSVLVLFNSNGNYVRNINLRTYARLPKGISLLDDNKLLVASQNGVAILQIGRL